MILLNDNKTLAFIWKFYVWTIATKKNIDWLNFTFPTMW